MTTNTDYKRLTQGGTIKFTTPNIGFVNLIIGKQKIDGISYVNPYVVYDVTNWLLSAYDNNRFELPISSHDECIYLDCESLGMTHLTLRDKETIIVTRETDIAYDDEICDKRQTLIDYTTSIEDNFDAWVEFECAEEDEVEAAKKNLQALINRLYAEINLLTETETPTETFNRLCQIPTNELTPEDIDILKNLFALRMSLDHTKNHPNVVQATWEIDNLETKFKEHRLQFVRLTAKCSYFENRQLVFIRENNYVELANWADSKNANAIRETFSTWCAIIRKIHNISPYTHL